VLQALEQGSADPHGAGPAVVQAGVHGFVAASPTHGASGDVPAGSAYLLLLFALEHVLVLLMVLVMRAIPTQPRIIVARQQPQAAALRRQASAATGAAGRAAPAVSVAEQPWGEAAAAASPAGSGVSIRAPAAGGSVTAAQQQLPAEVHMNPLARSQQPAQACGDVLASLPAEL
jgi:hypothetical protein